ncbi:MAG: transposase [Methylotenera sp.]|nr:transposase [Oligoflexia bacterium]
MKNKTYTKEFKQQAVELAESLGSRKEASRQLGVSDASIHNWAAKFGSQTSKVGSASAPLSATDAEELKRLRRENADLKKVNHILKSAAAFFSQDHLK